MTDVLTIARERQRVLRDEITELDEFIRMAETLLQGAKGQSEGARKAQDLGRASVIATADAAPEQAEDETVLEQQDSDEAAEVAEADDSAESESGVRKFPWTGQQPAVRRTGTDDGAGPTRRNIFRRDMSAAG